MYLRLNDRTTAMIDSKSISETVWTYFVSFLTLHRRLSLRFNKMYPRDTCL